ncbi:MAG: hypothetical protein RTU92_11710 [Candidatus Thorarchaeota archaeon]
MSIEMILTLFFVSVILCGVAGAIVKRYEIQIPKMILVIFHIIYITGLLATSVFL